MDSQDRSGGRTPGSDDDTLHYPKVVLVTGACRFLGGYLTARLAQNPLINHVIAVDAIAPSKDLLRRMGRAEFVRADIRNPFIAKVIRNGDVDTVVHAAAASYAPRSGGRAALKELNVMGAIQLFAACQKAPSVRRVVLKSTSEVYGDPEVHPQQETYWGHVNPIGPRSCYDEGKRCAETLFFDYGRQHKLKIKVLRIFNTYGPRMQPNDGRVVSNFIVQALNNQPLTIYGDGLQTRSFCFVDDLVRGMIGLMNSPDSISGPINCGNPNEFTIRDLAEKVIAMTGSGSRIVHRPLPQDDPRQRRPDISQAQELLNWRPTVMLTEGLQRTIAYFDKLHSKDRNRVRENRSAARPRSSPRSKIRELAQNGDAASQEAVTSTSYGLGVDRR